MTTPQTIDGVLIQWGDRLFYSGNRVVKVRHQPRLPGRSAQSRAAEIRARIAATVARRAPQVMVKVTGGGRGMNAIAAHFRYISKNGRLAIEDDRGQVTQGKGALRELVDDWRFGGSFIADEGEMREAFNIMLSMPRGTDPLIVQRAAREFAQAELADHKYVMVLRDHQANPHVHISVRAESRTGRRLNPRKTDLHRWRETFAEKLRGWGVDAEATRQASAARYRTARRSGGARPVRTGGRSRHGPIASPERKLPQRANWPRKPGRRLLARLHPPRTKATGGWRARCPRSFAICRCGSPRSASREARTPRINRRGRGSRDKERTAMAVGRDYLQQLHNYRTSAVQ